MLLKRVTRRDAVGGPACKLVVVIQGRFNFLVSQSDARCRTRPLESLEEFLWQFIGIAVESLARIERSKEIQAPFTHSHQLFDGDIPTSDRVDHLHRFCRAIQGPRGTKDELAK